MEQRYQKCRDAFHLLISGVPNSDLYFKELPESEKGEFLTQLEAKMEVIKTLSRKDKRREAYPSIGEQLDTIYHKGIEGWRADIKKIKDENPI